MSSPTIRSAIMAEVTRLAGTLPVFNLSDYVSLSDLPVNSTNECLLVDFVASSDRMVTIGGEGNQGWEEDGTIALHWLAPTGFDSDPVLVRADVLRLALRGRRLGKIVIETVEPFADSGSPVDVDGGWTGFSTILSYSRNTCG